MLTPLQIPDVGAGGHVLTISAWFVEPGDAVQTGERLCEILLSGVTCEVNSPCDGTLTRIVRDLDAPVAVGETVAWIESR